MTTDQSDDSGLRERLLALVPVDGSPIGNTRLQRQLADSADATLTDGDYQHLRDTLITEGVLLRGQGRGGSVRRALVEADQPLDQTDDLVLTMPVAPEPQAPSTAKAKTRATAPRGPANTPGQVLSYRHDDKRKNNPHVGMVDTASDGEEAKTRWAHDPHIDPALNFDPARAGIESLIDDALASGDHAQMRAALQQLKRMQAPYLDWSGKAERTSFAVDTVSLHVHERIDPATLLAALQKRLKSPSPAGGRGAGVREPSSSGAFQPDLFHAPFENLPLREAIDFYKHERDWANRLIAGDSLLVMNSLLQKESLAGQVQMIYLDPPYGIKYGSNFQPFVNKRDVTDRKDEDLTQEPEMIKAFRDTWELGIHSYLTYLRDRLLLARELLSESGSVFVQISDENLHHVREMCDEIFNSSNMVSVITVVKTSAQEDLLLPSVCDYLVWYAKNKDKVKYRKLWLPKDSDPGASEYNRVEIEGRRRRMTADETLNESILPSNARIYRQDNIVSQRPPGSFPVEFERKTYQPITGYWKTGELGFPRLIKTQRIEQRGRMLSYVRFFDDFPVRPISNFWGDVRFSSRSEDKAYVVQTAMKVIERCLLMTTDPGDLVLDPTCGSGTTAFVAEKWGRRWITCDTSRVAVTLAKQRLMTASYDYYELKYPNEGLKGGFIYKTVPHVMLKSIANNPEIDEIWQRMHPAIDAALAQLNRALLPPSPAGGRGAGGEGLDYRPNPPAKLPEEQLRHAREMRKGATDAENLLWQLLRNRRLANAKFRRQHSIGKFIADFYCDEQRLVIELDGGQHAEQMPYDAQRTAFLQAQGLTVLRFWNNQVLNETEAVLQVIWEHVAKGNNTLTPSPSPVYGRGEQDALTPSPSPASGRGEQDALTPTPLPPAGEGLSSTLTPLPEKEGLEEWEVPFDFSADWPESARGPFDAFRAARQAMQKKMDASIAAHADQETLYDQPQVSRTKRRITGPFTVEAVPFPTVLALDEAEQPANADVAVARSGETARQANWRDELLKAGIRGKGGQKLKLADLEPLPGARYVHAVGTVIDEPSPLAPLPPAGEGNSKTPSPLAPLPPAGEGNNKIPSPQPFSQGERGLARVAVSFGPQHAALEQRQVEIAMREAGDLFPLPKMLVFCAFTFDPEAAKDIDNIKGITALKVQMNTDLLTEDLKKARASNESFWLMGQPDVAVRRVSPPSPAGGRGAGGEGDWYQVEVNGFDYFDTASGELKSGGKRQIAMWALDTDYDNRSLYPRQVFFPMAGDKDGWHKLKKDIRAELDEGLLAQFHGTVSLPFAAGDNRCIAVKIVDDRGIESLKVMNLE